MSVHSGWLEMVWKQVLVWLRCVLMVIGLAGGLAASAGTAAPVWLAQLSTSEAAAIVARRTGGKVLKVTEEERGGERVYRVKVLLPEGRIKTVFVNKATGGVGG
ncbi:MAG: PepSY domain-containing protein [Pseudomonadota bacterium]|nr:hypothetical protein [Pseudomonadales bacterium]MDY6922127.1 PepSY domain-containing protein [Pseudomonadota bacterium]